jgi:hypothetical protein
MKRIILTLSAFAMVGAILTSCNKGVISAKKLDGEWVLVLASSETNSTYDDGDDTYETSWTNDFDGTTMTTVYTDDEGDQTTSSNPYSNNVTFDREAGEYTAVEVGTDDEGEWVAVYIEDSIFPGYYPFSHYVWRKDITTSTTTTSGIYTLSGDAGEEIEKNSQIVFQVSSVEDEWTAVYTYFEDEDEDDEADMDGLYFYDAETGEYSDDFPSGKTGTSSTTGSNLYTDVWTVTELKKGEMVVDVLMESNNESSDSDVTTSSTTSGTMTFEQK